VAGRTTKRSAGDTTSPRAERTGVGGAKLRADTPEIRQYRPGKLGYSLAGFARFCSRLVLEDGSRMKLEAFERRVLREHFGGAKEVVILLPKKNYKTTLIAALGLYHLEEIPDARVIMGAAARDQARIIQSQAEGLATRSGLPHVCRYREIRHNGGVMYALSADAATGDGVIPTLALVDELHRHKSGSLYGLFRDGLEARDGRMITISTAGYDSESPLGKLRTDAHAMPSFTRKGVYNHAAKNGFAFHEWALTNDDDLSDIRLVKRVNPAKHHTLASLRRRFESPSMTRAQWARFACGLWGEGEEQWIEPSDWDRLGVDIGKVLDGDEVWVAVRLGQGAGIGIVARRDGGRVAVRSEVLPPPPGGRVGFRDLERTLRGLCDRYDVRQIGVDYGQFGRASDVLEMEGLPVAELPQRPARLIQATATLYRLISSKLLMHDGDPDLRTQVLAGRTKETTTGWYLEPTPRTNALIALAMATHQAMEAPSEPPAFVAL